MAADSHCDTSAVVRWLVEGARTAEHGALRIAEAHRPPANSESKARVISTAAKRMPIDVPVSPVPFK
jgi:hypothetical protein